MFRACGLFRKCKDSCNLVSKLQGGSEAVKGMDEGEVEGPHPLT